jgi:hypothetical protein
MQSAEAVLGVLRERGRKGLPCNELYRQLFNPQLYLLLPASLIDNGSAGSRDNVSAKLGDDAYVAAGQGAAPRGACCQR